jgi:hypothetical protein
MKFGTVEKSNWLLKQPEQIFFGDSRRLRLKKDLDSRHSTAQKYKIYDIIKKSHKMRDCSQMTSAFSLIVI